MLMVRLFLSLVRELSLPLLFYVPDISHVPHLTMNQLSTSYITDTGCRVILDADSCSGQDRHT
jgi:hypothetical protein